MLGANELPLRQGFRLRRKRLYGAPAPPRSRGPEGKGVLPSSGAEGGQLHRTQAPHLLLPAPQSLRLGGPSLIYMLGANELPLRQGFRLRRKRLYGAPAPPRSAGPRGQDEDAPAPSYSSSLRTARNASVGSCTEPRLRIFFLPSFCFSSSFFFRVMSPP